jgi:tyrosinase
MSPLRIRYSLQYVQYLYDSGEDRSKLENLIRAFRGIQALPPDDPKSFFYLAGLHGLPFRGPGETDPNWWGGYCWHASALFPTWHRIYVLSLEDALRSIPGCQDVTLPFWDELANLSDAPFNPDNLRESIPSVLTSQTFELDGRTDNPLYSYRLQKALVENVADADHRYSKHEGYETVRYPLSGEYCIVLTWALCYDLRMLIYDVYQA